MATTIIKNTGGTSKTWGGVLVTAAGQRTIEEVDRLRLLSDTFFLADLTSGVAVVNTGTSDLAATEGLTYLRGVAVEYHFNNATNGFVSQNVQAAIEEARSTAEGKARWMASPGFDGTASTGRYLEFSSNVDSNQAGLVIPRATSLKELSLGLNTSGTVTFTIYKWNGTIETALTTISTSSSRKAIVTGLNKALVANDELRVRCTSGSGSRPIVFMFFQNT